MGIEYHHIHHYSTKVLLAFILILMFKVPGYLLQKCHEEAPEGLWKDITILSYSDMLSGLKYTLYDEDAQKFISFDEVDETPNTPRSRNKKLC